MVETLFGFCTLQTVPSDLSRTERSKYFVHYYEGKLVSGEIRLQLLVYVTTIKKMCFLCSNKV